MSQSRRRHTRTLPSIVSAILYGILWAGTPARATDVTLRLEDQHGVAIPASQFFVAGQVVDQDATIELPEGSHAVEIRAGLNGLASGTALRRVVVVDVGPSQETFTWTWKTAPWKTRIADQGGVPIAGSLIQPGWSGPGSLGFATLGNDEPLDLPITEDDDPSAPEILGGFSDGYPARLLVGINGQVGHHLRRNEPALEHPVGGTDHSYVWQTAPLSMEIVDQLGQPIPESFMYPGGTHSGFASLGNGESILVPVTEDPGVPEITSTFGNGYPVRLLPGINGLFAAQGALNRDEPALEHPVGGSHRIFEWKTAPVTFELIDQHGQRIPESRIWAGRDPHWYFATLTNGEAVILPLTEDPAHPPVYNGLFADGYPTRLLPGTNGVQTFQLERTGEARELDSTVPQTWTYVWETTTCPLYLVGDDGRAVPGAAVDQSPVFGALTNGSTVSLPITDPVVYPTLGTTYADGYPDVFLRTDPAAPFEGPFTFSFLTGGTIEPSFVTVAAGAVGLRCVADVVGSATLFVPEGLGTVAGAPVEVPIELDTGGDDIAAIAFSVDYDEACLALDATDGDGDGVPDAVDLSLPAPFTGTVTIDPGDSDGEIDVTLFSIPVTSFPDGTVASITFQTTCTPPTGGSVLAPVGFSQDPVATFGDSTGADVPGNTLGDEVKILSGLRGDCNGNGMVTAADISSLVLELFDGDGDHWLDVPDGSFPGNPVGCDANSDQTVDSGDLSCIGNIIFGGSCDHRAGARSAELPWLWIETREAVPGDTVRISVHFDPRGWGVNTAVLSLDLRTDLVLFDTTDGDGDGIPDAVEFGDLPGTLRVADFDLGDSDGELDVVLADLSVSPDTFEGGLLVEIELELLNPSGAIDGVVVFSPDPSPSFGTPAGKGIAGNAVLFTDSFESGGFEAWSRVVTP